jgi:hypothetical protein
MDFVTTAPAPHSIMCNMESPVSSMMPDATMLGFFRRRPAMFTFKDVMSSTV